MLLVQKFLINKKDKVLYPVPDEAGVIAYSYRKGDTDQIHYEFIHYKWEYTKTHPSYYYIKYFNMVNQNKSNSCFMSSQTKYVPWSGFFAEMENIKKSLKKEKEIHTAKSSIEAENMLWRCFLKTNDLSFASIIRSLPESFYKSVDSSLSFSEQEENRKYCLDFLEIKAPHIFASWEYFFDVNITSKFCGWFTNYFDGNI